MAFKFKFETLLNVRKIQENMAQQSFFQAQKQLNSIVAMKEQVMMRRDILKTELMTRMKDGLSSVEVKAYYDYIAHLDQGIELFNKKIKTAENLVNEKRKELLKAKRSFKAIIRLKDIHQNRFNENEGKKEMRFLDEIAVTRAGGER